MDIAIIVAVYGTVTAAALWWMWVQSRGTDRIWRAAADAAGLTEIIQSTSFGFSQFLVGKTGMLGVRLKGASPGQLSLAESEGGEVSLVDSDNRSGRLSLTDSAATSTDRAAHPPRTKR